MPNPRHLLGLPGQVGVQSCEATVPKLLALLHEPPASSRSLYPLYCLLCGILSVTGSPAPWSFSEAIKLSSVLVPLLFLLYQCHFINVRSFLTAPSLLLKTDTAASGSLRLWEEGIDQILIFLGSLGMEGKRNRACPKA